MLRSGRAYGPTWNCRVRRRFSCRFSSHCRLRYEVRLGPSLGMVYRMGAEVRTQGGIGGYTDWEALCLCSCREEWDWEVKRLMQLLKDSGSEVLIVQELRLKVQVATSTSLYTAKRLLLENVLAILKKKSINHEKSIKKYKKVQKVNDMFSWCTHYQLVETTWQQTYWERLLWRRRSAVSYGNNTFMIHM